MALDKFRASPLPGPPGEWDPQYMRQVIRVLENYFSQLDSNTPNNAQRYTADQFIGGNFSGTDIAATDVNTTTLEAVRGRVNALDSNRIGVTYIDADSIHTVGLLSTTSMSGAFFGGLFYGDGRNIITPYTVLQSSSNQTLPAIDQAVAVTYNTNDFPGTISIGSPSSRIVVSQEGIYQFTFSLQFQSTSTGTELVNVWFRKNGTDIASSNSQFSMPPRKSAGVPAALIAVTPFMFNLAANDYVEIMWGSTATTTSLSALGAVSFSAGVTPAIPATPSAIVAVQFVSAKFPAPTFVAPLPVFGFGEIGAISVVIR
jgi:hypothetical protein